MRRLAAVLFLILAGIVVGSAAILHVDGGVLHVFEIDIDIDLPSQNCEGRTQSERSTDNEFISMERPEEVRADEADQDLCEPLTGDS